VYDYLLRRHHRARLVRDVLRAQILAEEWAQGLLPSEEELAQRFDVGRNVMRESLNMLVQENLLRRIPGRGTQATSRIVVHDLNSLRAIAEEEDGSDESPRYELLHWGLVPAPGPVAESLGLPAGTPVVLWERLTRAAVPMVLWSSYLRPNLGLTPPPQQSDTRRGGTFAFLESFGLDLGRATVHSGAAPADQGTAELLEVSIGATLLLQHRQTLLRDGTTIEVGTGYHRPDQIFFVNDFERLPKSPVG
jgi:GntR family transcriptional regulator